MKTGGVVSIEAKSGKGRGPEIPREERLRRVRHSFDLMTARAEQHAVNARDQAAVAESLEHHVSDLRRVLAGGKVGELTQEDYLLSIERLASDLAGSCGGCQGHQAAMEQLEVDLRALVPDVGISIPWNRLETRERADRLRGDYCDLRLDGWTFENAPAVKS